MKHTVFSGIKPSGQLHLGNYFGTMQGWPKLQNNPDNDCIFAVVDYHALTEGMAAQELNGNIFEIAVDFLAAGVDPEKSTLMIQSWVPEHTELCWILNCVTPISWLERVPTFKDSAEQFKNNLNMGLLDYPVLMAADILLYNADLVPVGQDQFPHLELAREIARAFNAKYGQIFIEPKEKITPTPKLMALTDPTKKMSKSLGPKSYIALADTPAEIEQKIKSMVTMTGDEKKVVTEFIRHTKEIHTEFADLDGLIPDHQEVRAEKDLNTLEKELGKTKYHKFMALYNFYMLLYIFAESGERRKFIVALKEGSVKFSEYKQLLVDKIIAYPPLKSLREKRAELLQQPEKVWEMMKKGSLEARQTAQKNLSMIKKKIGLV
jgi:tryptophanyl-tRNA synthetase